MGYNILKNSPLDPGEIEGLRDAVGWDRSEGIYEQVLKRYYAYYSIRLISGKLVGYLSVLSDGITDAFLLDLMVHPDFRGTGMGRQLVITAIRDLKQAGIRCIQVTFNDRLESFYTECGFHILKGGIIDFKNMNWDENYWFLQAEDV